jgi:phage-related minor tail protein
MKNMSRINMKVGITAEQVNEANAAYKDYLAALSESVDDMSNAEVIGNAVSMMNEAAAILSAALGDDHMATRRVTDAMARATEAGEKITRADEKRDARISKLRAKVRSYDGWFVMIDNERVPVVDAETVDGIVAFEGKNYPFIPVYFPGNSDAESGLKSLFDD